MSKNKKKRGFTLIELLAVLVVIGICFGVAINVSKGLLSNSSTKTKEVNVESIYKGAIMYTEEYKKEDDWVVEVGKNVSSNSDTNVTGYEFICMRIKELKDKGYIDRNAVLGDNLNDNSLILVKRDVNTKSYDKFGGYVTDNTEACNAYDNAKPTVEVNISNSSNSDGWYTSDISGTITATTGNSGISKKNYFYEVDGVKTDIPSSNGNSDNFTINSDGSSIRVCASIVNGVGKSSGEVCKGPLKRDTTTPSLSYKIDGNKTSGNWYNSDISGTIEASVGKSGIKSINYYIDIDGKKETFNTTSNNSKFNINKEGKVIRICGKVVNGAGVSSGEDICTGPYSVDKTKPVLSTKGSIGSSNIDPVYTDNLSTVTVKKCITTSKSVTKGDSCFNSATYPSYVSGTTYYLFSYGIDSAGNESEIELNNEYTYVYHSSSSGSHSSSSSSSSCNSTCQMKKNSEKWHEINNNSSLSDSEKKSQQDALHKANEKLASNNSACKGSCSYNSNSGTWSDSTGKNLYNSSDLKNSSKSSSSNKSSSSSSKSSSSKSSSSSSSSKATNAATSAATKAAKNFTNSVKNAFSGRK